MVGMGEICRPWDGRLRRGMSSWEIIVMLSALHLIITLAPRDYNKVPMTINLSLCMTHLHHRGLHLLPQSETECLILMALLPKAPEPGQVEHTHIVPAGGSELSLGLCSVATLSREGRSLRGGAVGVRWDL